MKKGYYIYNPFSRQRRLVSAGELIKLTNLTFHELYNIVKNCIYLKNLGFILPSDTSESKFKLLESTKFWARLTLPCECDYEISHHGEVRRILANGSKSKPLKPQFNKTENRYYVNLSIDNKRVHLYLDAAVVHHFFDGTYDAYDIIEYIDNDPSNVHYSNLKVIPNKVAPDERWTLINRKGSTYEVSNYGRVRNILNFRYTYLQNTPKGNSDSLCVHLSLPEKKGFYSVSRLVAEHFLSDFTEDLYVSFKDGDNANLYYKNLTLLSKQDLARKTLNNSRKLRSVICTDTTSNETLGPFSCAREAAKELGISPQAVSDNLNNRSKLAAWKYIFKYAS